MKLTKKELMEVAATLFSLISDGYDDSEIMSEMGLTALELTQLKAKMFDLKSEELRTKPIEHTYVEYMLNQLHNVHDLTVMIGEYKESKQANAIVGAVRARAEIYDKMLAKGQDCGLIKKVAERKEIVAGVLIGDLSNEQLRKMVVKELGGLKALAGKYGDTEFMALPAPIDLHHGPSLKDEMPTKKKKKKKGKRVKAKTSKVSGGRVRTLPPAPIPTGE